MAIGLKTTGLRLVSASPRMHGAVREATTGRVVAVLPNVWAVGELTPVGRKPIPVNRQHGLGKSGRLHNNALTRITDPDPLQQGAEIAFYRKYTEAMVRRYRSMSLEAGRVPSLMGRELFRGNVTSYQVQSFEDVVIFCCDMEKCLLKLNKNEQKLVKRIALQEYTFGEAAGMLGLSLSHCIRQYGRAVDRLTAILLEAKLLQPLGALRS